MPLGCGIGRYSGGVTLAALVIAVVALVLAAVAVRRTGVVERRARAWAPAPGSYAAASDPPMKPAPIQAAAAAGLSRVAVVRYDAFKDVGGELSYSVALVDDQGEGLVLTTINGRTETRTYVKELPIAAEADGASKLSPEEVEALRKAMS